MHRTTIMLPARLKAQAERRARELGISLGELIRVAVAKAIGNGDTAASFLDDNAVYEGPAPADGALNHDRYLYGEDEA